MVDVEAARAAIRYNLDNSCRRYACRWWIAATDDGGGTRTLLFDLVRCVGPDKQAGGAGDRTHLILHPDAVSTHTVAIDPYAVRTLCAATKSRDFAELLAVHLERGECALTVDRYRNRPQWTAVRLAVLGRDFVFANERYHALVDTFAEALDCLAHAARRAEPRTHGGPLGTYAGACW